MHLTIPIAAEAVGVTRQTVNNWIRRGTLAVTVIDGKRFVDAGEVKARAEWKWKHAYE